MASKNFRALGEERVGRVTVLVGVGSLVEVQVDAIVCPANSFATMRGGVAAVIIAAGGEIIEREAIGKAPIQIGRAVSTSAGNLPCRWVIHAPTMIHSVERATSLNVRRATIAALRLASSLGCRSIAFPGMGTGTGGLDFGKAAQTMVECIRTFQDRSMLQEVVLVALDENLPLEWLKAIAD